MFLNLIISCKPHAANTVTVLIKSALRIYFFVFIYTKDTHI